MPELEGCPHLRRQAGKKIAKEWRILFERGRKLEKHRAKFLPEGPDRIGKGPDCFTAVAQFGEMRDSLRGLETELESFRRRVRPAFHTFRAGNLAKGVVDLS